MKIRIEVIVVILCCSIQASKALMEIACQSSNVVTPTAQPDGAERNYNRHVFWNTQVIWLAFVFHNSLQPSGHRCKNVCLACKRAQMQRDSQKKRRNKSPLCKTASKRHTWDKNLMCACSPCQWCLHYVAPNKENNIPQSSPASVPTHTAAREQHRSTQASAGGSKNCDRWLVC